MNIPTNLGTSAPIDFSEFERVAQAAEASARAERLRADYAVGVGLTLLYVKLSLEPDAFVSGYFRGVITSQAELQDAIARARRSLVPGAR